MNAAVLKDLRVPRPGEDTVTLDLVTQTPLYTGGIGQWGDQIHPSGLLGSIRYFSCLVARTLGDAEFERKVWGWAGDGRESSQAKQVALRWITADEGFVDLPKNLKRPHAPETHRGWFYNRSYSGSIKLIITRKGISLEHWKILMLALRIQIRNAMFGAKDQFGLGVIACRNMGELSVDSTYFKGLDLKQHLDSPNLGDALFAKFRVGPLPMTNIGDQEARIQAALNIRTEIRNLFRKGFEEDSELIRHYLCGSMVKDSGFGSALNVSSLYPAQDAQKNRYAQARLFLLLPHTHEPDRDHKSIRSIQRHRGAVIRHRKSILEKIESWIKAQPNAVTRKLIHGDQVVDWLLELSR